MSIKNKPLSRKEDIVVQELEGEVLIYDLRVNKAFCLNETSALIWQACDGSKDVPQISEFVASHLNTKANEDLVWLALDQLKKEKLIDNAPESDGRFAGMSRRDVIKKVGLGTMMALPIIASLAAPAALNAQSGIACTCPNGQVGNAMSCTNSPQCMAPNGTCSGVSCNGGGNSCGTLNGTCI